MLRLHAQDLISNQLNQTMPFIQSVFSNARDKVIIIDPVVIEQLKTHAFGNEAIHAIYQYKYLHPEQKIYIGMLLSRQDIIGPYIGSTAIRTKQFLEHNINNIILINELGFGANDTFGHEAINTIDQFIYDNKSNNIFYI